MGKFGSEEEDLGGVVDPDDDDDQGTGRTVCRAYGSFGEVEPDERFTEGEEESGGGGAEADIAPGDLGLGDELKYCGE